MSTYLGNQLLSGVATNTISNAHSLLDFKWTDHILNEMSWLRADTFSWHNGNVYVGVYNHLVADLGTQEQTTYYAWAIGQSYLFTLSPTPSEGDILYNGSGSYYPTYTDDPSDLRYGIFTPTTNTVYRTDGSTYIKDNDGENNWDRSNGFDTPIPEYPNQHSETIAGIEITYYQAPDGHKIVLPDQESNVEAIYNSTGVSWYYILDIENHRFKLPRENPVREELIQVVRAKGNDIALGLKGSDGVNYGACSPGANAFAGASSQYGVAPYTGNKTGYNPTAIGFGITTDSTKSGIISDMKDSTSVYKGKQYLYFYVGQFSQSATEQTAGLNSSLFNGKADIDLSNAAPNASASAKQTIVGWGIPDYDSAVSLSAPTTSYQDYTATKPCMIELLCFYMAGALTYKINNHEYNIGGNTTSQQQGGCLMHIYLDTGDVLSYKTQYTNQGTIVVNRATMFPLKGV